MVAGVPQPNPDVDAPLSFSTKMPHGVDTVSGTHREPLGLEYVLPGARAGLLEEYEALT